MIELNKHTGFYRGNIIHYKGGIWRNDCVPAAVGNYLSIKNVPHTTIMSVIKSLCAHDKYDTYICGFDLCSIPQAIEACMREHLDPVINVKLYLSGATGIPFENKHHVESFDGRRSIPVPCIVVTHYENTREDHLWVATSDNGIITRIDNDGDKHPDTKPVAGYVYFQNLSDCLMEVS